MQRTLKNIKFLIVFYIASVLVLVPRFLSSLLVIIVRIFFFNATFCFEITDGVEILAPSIIAF